ncbi:MAG: hypothetical protein U0441_04935 [Polyangiaceae bacterium]
MRWRAALGPCLLFLGGCIEPSCDLDWGCKNDYSCAYNEVCGDYGECMAAVHCESSDCPAGMICRTRSAVPAGNPFTSDKPGKKVCVCNDGYGDELDPGLCDGSSEGGYGTGATGGGGSGGTGGGPGGALSCAYSPPEGDVLEVVQTGDAESQGSLFITQALSVDGPGTLEALTFKGTIDLGGETFTSQGDSDVAVVLREHSGAVYYSELIGNAGPNVVTAAASDAYGYTGGVAVSFTGALTFFDGEAVDAGAGTGAVVFVGGDIGPNRHVFFSNETLSITGISGGFTEGSLVVAGTFTGTLTIGSKQIDSTGGADGFIAYLHADPAKEAVWIKQIGGAGDQTVSGVADGGQRLFAIGDYQGETDLAGEKITSDGRDSFVLALDSTGQFMGSRVIKGPDRQVLSAAAVDVETGHLVAAGVRASESMSQGSIDFGDGVTMEGGPGLSDAFVVEYAPNLDLGWISLLSGAAPAGEVVPRDMTIDCAGQITVVGQTTGAPILADPASGYGKYDAFVVKLDHGAVLWSHVFGGPEDDLATSVVSVEWQSVIVGGSFSGAAAFGPFTLQSAGAEDAFRAYLTP